MSDSVQRVFEASFQILMEIGSHQHRIDLVNMLHEMDTCNEVDYLKIDSMIVFLFDVVKGNC